MEEYQVAWTPNALVELDQITVTIAEESRERAKRIRDDILKRIANLARFPLIGSMYRTRRRHAVREIAVKKYRIFYRVIEEARRVEILSIWHGARRDPPLA